MVKDNWEIVCHDVLVFCCQSDCDLIKCDPVFEILLAIVLFKLLELEVAGSYDLAKV